MVPGRYTRMTSDGRPTGTLCLSTPRKAPDEQKGQADQESREQPGMHGAQERIVPTVVKVRHPTFGGCEIPDLGG